ncbi:hypothetical protein [Paenibacillus arenosi]|uniref:2TM domain-containing protein n=1 Tax=Paenibacillus arenosi TaxID=2774142 RepID=A0ABR9B283_9BACL|nr:hypothetical protein [Paenibacillus arenosi]MBD8500093.1 hypothetical protein [Paenibacillus arenosi]
MNMILLSIVIGEIAFWVFLFAGLLFRYVFKMKKLSTIFLLLTPLIDIFVLSATLIDLSRGAPAHFVHGLSAAYIGFTLIYGKRTIQWADRWAAYRWGAGNRPLKKKLVGKDELEHQWHEFKRFCSCMMIINVIISMFYFFVPPKQTFWFTYWIINNVGLIFIWLFVGPIWSKVKHNGKSST